MAGTELVPLTKRKPKTEQTEDVEVTPDVPAQPTELLESTDALLDKIDKILDQDAIAILRENLASLDAEQVPVEKPYTLADAIREGSSVTKQKVGGWTGQQGETCALSAAMLAVRARGLA